jgi:hypothetical protein
MSLDAMVWAVKDAPTANPTEKLVLIALAERAKDDGRNAFLSKKSLANRALCDPKTAQRCLGSLRDRGLIAKGDQSAADYIDPRYRPVVYDLLIPYSWYGAKIERVNEDRAELGLGPLTPDARPDIAPAPPRATRSDKGIANPNRRPKSLGPRPDQDEQDMAGNVEPRGDSQSPLNDAARGDSQSQPGGIVNPAGGDSQSPEPQVRNQDVEPPHPPSGGEGAQARPPTRDTSSGQPSQETLDGAPADAEPKRRQRTTVWPGRFTPTADLLAWAAQEFPMVDTTIETSAFNGYYSEPARVKMRGDWRARWRKWITNAAAYGPSKAPTAPPDELEAKRVARLAGCWWARYEGRPVMTGTRAELDRLVLMALRAGASDSDINRALARCAEPVPHPKRFERALLGEPAGWSGGGRPANLGPDLGDDPNAEVHAERRRYFG